MKIEGCPDKLLPDPREALGKATQVNLAKAWRAAPPAEGDNPENSNGPRYDMAPGEPNTPDAANRGQMGDRQKKPSCQGEKEVGTGGHRLSLRGARPLFLHLCSNPAHRSQHE